VIGGPAGIGEANADYWVDETGLSLYETKPFNGSGLSQLAVVHCMGTEKLPVGAI